MRSPKLNQGSELNDIVNKRNKWLFSNVEVSRYLVNRNDSLLIPSGNIWYSSLTAYPSYCYSLLKLIYFLVKHSRALSHSRYLDTHAKIIYS